MTEGADAHFVVVAGIAGAGGIGCQVSTKEQGITGGTVGSSCPTGTRRTAIMTSRTQFRRSRSLIIPNITVTLIRSRIENPMRSRVTAKTIRIRPCRTSQTSSMAATTQLSRCPRIKISIHTRA